jgi:hypothetical protein
MASKPPQEFLKKSIISIHFYCHMIIIKQNLFAKDLKQNRLKRGYLKRVFPTVNKYVRAFCVPGLPDFSCYNIPKREKYTK